MVGMIRKDFTGDGRKKLEHWFNPIDPSIDFIRPGRSFFDLMLENLNIICCPSVLARRNCYELVGGFDKRLPFSLDMEMWMRISLFFDIAFLSQPLIQYRYHESNATQRFVDLDLIHIYLSKRMLLEKYPDVVTATHYETMIKDTTQRIFERAIHHYRMRQYKTAKQYLYFLETIRSSIKKSEFIDIQIHELQSYVNQSNAINLIMRLDKKNKAASKISKYFQNSPSRSINLITIINTLKPYIPMFIKNRLRRYKENLIG